RTGKVLLPNGELLSPNRLRSIGHLLGTSSGEQIHYLLEHDPHSPAFSHDVASMLPFRSRNPLYAVLHEACYADGGQTNWSAARTLPPQPEPGSPVLTGEHLFPWHFREDHGLVPFREVAELMAAIDWPRLYDVQALRTTTVPCAAAIYGDDPFVLRQYSEETAALIPGMRTWITNEYEHSGLRTSGTRVFDRLLALARDLTD
ncbi:MAG TPA: aminopeptidase, partial [Marmoricola sp.]|nr:aminopeptidase [Marmoricola sp.]